MPPLVVALQRWQPLQIKLYVYEVLLLDVNLDTAALGLKHHDSALVIHFHSHWPPEPVFRGQVNPSASLLVVRIGIYLLLGPGATASLRLL